MMTKAEEMKVLEKIKKLVESTGEGSYISMAFEGVLEDAEENIENDFGCSWKQRAEAAEKKITEYKKVRDELVEERDDLLRENKELQEDCDALNERIAKLREEKHSAEEQAFNEAKEIKVETAEHSYFGRFRELRYNRNDKFDFITVEEQDGWMQSYKMADITELTIQ